MAPADAQRNGGSAFGLRVESTYPIPGLLEHDPGRSGPPLRRTVCVQTGAVELERRWPAGEARDAVDLRYPDGRLFMSVRSHTEAGFRIWAPGHGRHLVSLDGTEITSALPRRGGLGWQRLFFAQTLPLAAALQGLEVLHASAVGLDGCAVAFTAPSGTGKSSLAAHLVAAGAEFLTDDVLALEAHEEGVRAHAGPARVSLASDEVRAMTAQGRARIGSRIRSPDKPLFAPLGAVRALPLAILYRVARGPASPQVTFREHDPPRAMPILASSFLSYLQTPRRLQNQLAVCDRVLSTVRTFDLLLPAGTRARDAAALVLAHSREVLSQ